MPNKKILLDKNTITIVTYNILLSRHSETIIQNIVNMAKRGVAVFCLQEVVNAKESFIVKDILKALGKQWQADYHLGNTASALDLGTCIIWNTHILKSEHTDRFNLPIANGLNFHELIFHKLAGLAAICPQRRITSKIFTYNNKKLQITSAHFDSVGGTAHRISQVRYLLQRLKNEFRAEYQIVCGDFNSFDLLKKGEEKQLLNKTFGKSFIDAAESITWTADLNKIDIPRSFPFFVLLLKILHIHVKRKLDYIWVRNCEVLECESLQVSGSDHLPVISKLLLR